MPIYEYQCQSCGHKMEAIQKIADAPLSKCPECGNNTLKKLVSAAAFRLKGSGWYETDFKTGDKKNLQGDKKPDKEKSKASDKKDKKGSKDSSAETS